MRHRGGPLRAAFFTSGVHHDLACAGNHDHRHRPGRGDRPAGGAAPADAVEVAGRGPRRRRGRRGAQRTSAAQRSQTGRRSRHRVQAGVRHRLLLQPLRDALATNLSGQCGSARKSLLCGVAPSVPAGQSAVLYSTDAWVKAGFDVIGRQGVQGDDRLPRTRAPNSSSAHSPSTGVLEKAFGPENGFVFAFKALPPIIFVSSLFTVLYYLGVLQLLGEGVRPRRWMFVMGTSGAETLSVSRRTCSWGRRKPR